MTDSKARQMAIDSAVRAADKDAEALLGAAGAFAALLNASLRRVAASAFDEGFRAGQAADRPRAQGGAPKPAQGKGRKIEQGKRVPPKPAPAAADAAPAKAVGELDRLGNFLASEGRINGRDKELRVGLKHGKLIFVDLARLPASFDREAVLREASERNALDATGRAVVRDSRNGRVINEFAEAAAFKVDAFGWAGSVGDCAHPPSFESLA